MVLLSRDQGIVELRVNGVFVMDSVHTETEQDLARVGLELCARPARVLVGGLGLGFTARACLEDPRVERVTVVEIEKPVVDWTKEGLIPGSHELVTDPRVEIAVADLADHVRKTGQTYDLVLLDIDNGPGYLVHNHNEDVYSGTFLEGLRGRLESAGVVVIWSASEDAGLELRMADTFTDAGVVGRDVDLQGRSERYFLYTGTR